MDRNAAIATLTSLRLADPQQAVSAVEDGSTSLLRTDSGANIALLRRGDKYDTLVLGAQSDCPVPSLRAVLETAVLPLSDNYAADIGVAFPERDAVRKRIREASVALDVIAKGRHFSVAPPDLSVHAQIRNQVESGATSADQLPDEMLDDLALLNQLQTNVVAWSREIDRIVQVSKSGPDAVLSVEEETVFWSSLDAALAIAQKKLSTKAVRVTLDVLARKRRATGFLIDANNSIDTARRKAAGVLTLIQGLPLVSLRTADDLVALRKGVTDLLEHVAAKLRVSAFSVERVLSLIESMGGDVSRSIGRVLSKKGGVLVIPFDDFVQIFEACCQLFEAWSQGFDHCRKVAREAARKKGETMPPRRKSPLSHLHSHLSDIYELRSDHQAIRAVLQDLITALPAAIRRMENLNSAYAWLLKQCHSFNHFSVSPAQEALWTQISATFRSKMVVVEEYVSSAYEDVVKTGRSIHDLAQSLYPFRRVLEKHFMSSAVAGAVPVVLGLGKEHFAILKKRELAMTGGCRRIRAQDAPLVASVVSEHRLLWTRAAALLTSIEQVAGKTLLEVTPDLREFAVDLNRLKERSDPSGYFSSWLSTVDMKVQSTSLFQVLHLEDVNARVEVSMHSDIALFFKVVRVARDDRQLNLSLTTRHLEFARFSKALFPVFSNLRDASSAYSILWDKLRKLSESKYERLMPFLSSRRKQSQRLFEDGFCMSWNDVLPKLLTYSSHICAKSSALANSLSVLVEKDSALVSAIRDLDSLQPRFSNGQLSIQTITQLQTSIKRFNISSAALHQSFRETAVHTYIASHWIPRLNAALMNFLQKLTSTWISALKSGQLSLPTVVLQVPYRSPGREGFSCSPSLAEVEQCLHCSLGNAFTAFVAAFELGWRDSLTNCPGCEIISAYQILHRFLGQQSTSQSYKSCGSPFSVINGAVEELANRAGSWGPYVGFLDPDTSEVVNHFDEDNECEIDVLEYLTDTYETVVSLRQEADLRTNKQDGSASGVHLDVSIVCGKITSNMLEVLRGFCDRTTSIASDKSQQLYQNISDAKNSILEASIGDGTETLVALQIVKENVLPSSRSSVEAFSELERKFESIAERIGDFSFSRGQSADSWILSEELAAHLKSLQDLYEQRIRSVLMNYDILQTKYEETKKEYQESLTMLFAKFQKIRNEDSEPDCFSKSTSDLSDLEEQLGRLDVQGLSLERVGKALGISQVPERTGPKNIITELKKVKAGIQQLSILEEKLTTLSESKIRDVNAASIRDSLTKWTNDADDISNSSGAKREAGHLKTQLSSLLQSHGLLNGLQSVNLSPPRERELLHRLFGEQRTRGGIGDVSLREFWDAGISQHAKYLRGVFENAAGEASICEFLSGIDRTWSARKCSFRSHGGVPILQGIPVLIDELEEHLQALETMSGSQYARLFESDRAAWEQRLAKCREDLEVLSDVQARWAHLRTLFGSGGSSGVSGLRVELQEEFTAFSNVHARFAALGERMESAPGILEGLEGPSGLSEMAEELAGIVRCLSKFLEKQRSRFPRFFFLSDNDLLHVLSVTSSGIEGLLPHISKLFPGVASFSFEVHNSCVIIDSVCSREGESLRFSQPITLSAKEQITSWLFKIQERVDGHLKSSLGPAMETVGRIYCDNDPVGNGGFLYEYMAFPAQIALLATKISFTSAVEGCIQEPLDAKNTLQKLATLVGKTLDDVCSSRLSPDIPRESRRKFFVVRDQIIKEFVYQRDLLGLLQKQSVRSVSSHHWGHELRFYHSIRAQNNEITDVVVRCGKGEFVYGWEYLGVGETLVHTSLTSRSFLALSEALRRGLGGSPFGPAGTGKTETVKALGRSMGRFVAVFNCDETFDAISVGRILAGACRVGSWVCFDEFNRLSASILSSTSGQLATLQASIRKGDNVVKNFYDGDLPVTIKPGVGIFVTMNPSYSGRRELPANLKSLFRPCAMSKPDSIVITEVLLLSQGFKSSAPLAKQLVSLFQNLKTTLPLRPHYDFGLRSLKSTVIASRSLLSSASRTGIDGYPVHSFEQDVVIRALGEILKPKLHDGDVSVYERAISVVFTEATCFVPTLPNEIEEALDSVMTEEQLVKSSRFIEKTRQLYSLLQHQSGVMLVGPTGSGKSAVWRTLYEAMRRLSSKDGYYDKKTDHRHCRSSLTVADAKLLSTKQLYGGLDAVTREWSDGLFTKTLRSLSESASSDEPKGGFPLHWIVFDGDVDPDWVENLNSVLDDNRILTLPNGEQVPLPENTRILFETEHLQHANPSTVSRCGMVCFGENSSMEEIFHASVVCFLRKISPECPHPSCLFDIVSAIVQLAQRVILNGNLVMQVPLQSMLDSVLNLLQNSMLKLLRPARTVLRDDAIDGEEKRPQIEASKSIFLRAFLVSIVKSLSGGLIRSEQCELSRMFWEMVEHMEEIQEAFDGVVRPQNFAEVAITSNGLYKEYQELVPRRDCPIRCEDIGSPDIVISTPTTVQLGSLLRDGLNLHSLEWPDISPLILCGPPGCGKTMLLTAALRNIPNISLATLSFSSETSPDNILAALRGHTTITKRPNGTFSLHPKSTGCRVVLFCDEVNLGRPDRYETQISISFLRSLAEHRGFWHGSPPTWVSVDGVQIVAACNPEEDSGRHRLPDRFLKHCRVVRVEQPNSRDLTVIYSVFVESLLKSVDHGLGRRAADMTSAMVEFFSLNKAKFCPLRTGPLEPHYIYSPRDLSRWIRGMKQLLPVGSDPSLEGTFDSGYVGEDAWAAVVSAFLYEARRIFCDRLLAGEERSQVDTTLVEIVKTRLSPDCNTSSALLYTSWLCNQEENTSKKCFRVVDDPERFRTLIYQKLRVFAEEEGLGGSWMGTTGSHGFDDSSAMIDQFAVTDDVLTHLTRLERILSQPLGHAVLMGAPGTGKKTLTRFAAWMLSTEVYQVHSHCAYSALDFANDLQQILRRAGVDNSHIMMIFDESNAMDSAFLEMMNSILACGDVPGLFSGDERSRLLDDLRTVGSGTGSGSNTEQAIYSEFVNRVRRNLHIVFTISTGCSGHVITSPENGRVTAGGDISQRSPALYNRCMVDWIGDWTRETLESVAELKIEVSLGREKDQIIRSAVQMHEIARLSFRRAKVAVEVTPRHYLEFIEQLNRIALEKGDAIQAGVERHTEGLHRLRNAGNAADNLKEELREKAERLQQKEIHANETLEKMVEEQRMAEKSKVAAEQLALAAQEASARVKEREEEVTEQLAAVQPKIEAAREAVGSIRREYLEELRAMPHPPAGVRIALEGVMMVLDASATSRKADAQYTWGSIRNRMRGSEFIASVVNFDAQSLPKGLRSRIERKILQNSDFDVNRISYASRAAGPLAEWTISVLDYAAVKEGVEPLQEEVNVLQEEQEELLDKQEAALHEVNVLQLRIEKCRTEYASLVAEAERVRQEIRDSEGSLARSEEMLDSLADEWDRWVKELNGYNAAAVTVWGNAVYGAAFVAYVGVLDHLNRSIVTNEWRLILKKEGIPFDEDLSLSEFLTTPEERGLWSAQSLPTDSTSLENYAILKRSARFPLIVDPSRNGTKLLRKVLVQSSRSNAVTDRSGSNEPDSLRITESSFSATGKKSYMRSLESAMRFGTSIVLEDADKFDRAVAPLLGQESSYGNASELVESVSATTGGNGLLSKDARRRSSICQRVVRLGDRDVFLSSNFRLYLAGVNIKTIPTAAVTRSNVVSFELSPAALRYSCVSRAMRILLPELEAKRKASLTAKQEYQRRKHELEESVLSAITDVEDLGTELLGGALLDSLSRLKQEVETIEKRQEEEVRASKDITRAESSFEALGRLAVDSFGVLQGLSSLHPVYVFPISNFLSLFDNAILSCKCLPISSTDGILSECQKSVLRETYSAVAASLFPKDRLPFASALAMVTFSHMDSNESRFTALEDLTRIRHAIQTSQQVQSGFSEFSPNEDNANIALKLVPHHLRPQVGIQSEEDLKESPFPLDGALRLLNSTLFEPHRVSEAIDVLACTLPGGKEMVHGKDAGSVASLYHALKRFAHSTAKDSKAKDNLFCPFLLCARGENSDPATVIAELAGQMKIPVMSVAMGSNHTASSVVDVIAHAVRKSDEGQKVLLLFKNMHLASKAAIECLHSEIMKRNGMMSCLCVVVIEVSSQFSGAQLTGAASPFRLLAFEALPNFRANFSSALEKVSSVCQYGSLVWKDKNVGVEKLQIAVSWLHACVLERSVHAPVGFSKRYEFSESDLVAAWEIVASRLSKANASRNALRGIAHMLTNAIYGCRIEDDADLDIVRALVEEVFSPERLISPRKSATLTVRGGDRHGPSICIPLNSDERSEYIRLMPLQAPPEWTHMPSDTNKKMQVAEGKWALNKVLLLSQEKFGVVEKDMESTSQGKTNSNSNLDVILQLGASWSSLQPISIKSETSSPLHLYVEAESKVLSEIIGTVLRDLDSLFGERANATRQTPRLSRLRAELLEVTPSEPGQMPEAWTGISSYFGSLSVADFFSKVREAVDAVQNVNGPKTSYINLSAVPRPAALLEALKYEQSTSCGVSPPSLNIIFTGESGRMPGSRGLHGVHLSGGRWDSKAKVFTISHDNVTDGEDLFINWDPSEEDTSGLEKLYVQVPLYGKGTQRTTLASIGIPVDKCSSQQDWRLCGACVSLD